MQTTITKNSITGSGGKSGGSTPTEAENTLQSDSIVSVLEVLSEGPIVGLVNGRQSIYFDDNPIDNTYGQQNYSVESDVRLGLPDQAYMSGWPSAESLHDVNLDVKRDTPAIYTVTATDVDAVRLIIAFPSGMMEQQSNGSIVGSSVQFSVRTAPNTGVYGDYVNYSKEGKSTSAFYCSYRVERPANSTGFWSVKVERITPDSTSAVVHNDLKLAQVVEIKDVKLQFNDTAYVGLKVSAKSVSNKIPGRSYHVKGLIFQVPNNYDPVTATYSGQWNGEFKSAWSDNPVWLLYDLLTNDRYGSGRWVKPEEIDVFSFYDAAVYCDELVPDGNGGFERRFTFNGQLTSQDDAVKVLAQVAGSFNAVLLREGSLYRIQQDRPSSPVAIITNANVIDGAFTYSGTPHQGRHTVVNVTFNDKKNRYRQQITTVEAGASDLERYNGITEINIQAVGAVTEGQAKRVGKWHIETELRQKEVAKFNMSFNGFDLRIGDVVKIADRDYTTIDCNGRVTAVVVNGDSKKTVTLDRVVEQQIGNTFSYVNAAGELKQVDVTAYSNTNTIVLTAGSDAPAVGGPFTFESTVKDRQFRITEYNLKDQNIIEFTAIEHDPNKYSRVEQGIDIPAPIYSGANSKRVNPPTNIKFTVAAYVNDEQIRRDLVVSWDQSVSSAVSHYNLSWRVNSGNWTTAKAQSNSYDITNINEGVFDVKVVAVGIDGTTSTALNGSYTFTLTGGSGSPLNAPTNLVVKGTSGTVFGDKNLSIQFTNPSQNTQLLGVLKDFRVDIKDGLDNIVRTEYVGRVDAGATQYYTYTYDSNQYDFGSAKRNVKITVYCRDTNNKLSVGTTATFANPAPAAPTVTVQSGVKSLKIETNIPDKTINPDYVETVICASDSESFTPSLTSNVVYRGPATFYLMQNITTPKYFACAHLDSFGDPANFSSIVSGVPGTTAGIPSGTVLPVAPSNNEYSFFLDVTDPATRGLYGWDGSKWVRVGDLLNGQVTKDKLASGITPIEVVSSLPATGNTEGRTVYLTTDKKLYRYTGSAWTASVDATDLTGQITSTQITDSSISTPKLAAGAVTATQIAARTITGDRLVAGTISAAEIAASTITGNQIAANAITSGLIAAGAVTSDKITTSNLAAISANMGAITAGSITLDQSGFIRGGATSYGVGTGIWQGYDSTTYKWRVGTPGSSRAEWTGTSFDIYDGSGNLTISSGVVDYSRLANKPGSLSNINSTESTKLNNIEANATVGATVGQNLKLGGSTISSLVSNLSPITAANISTYIASAAIGSAYIGDAAITNAKIGTAEISTLKIAGESVTVSRSAYTSSSYTTSAGGWFDLQYVSIDPGGGTVTVIGSANLTTNLTNDPTFKLRIVAPSGAVLATVVSTGDAAASIVYLSSTVSAVSSESGQYKLQGYCGFTTYSAYMSERFLLCLATKR